MKRPEIYLSSKMRRLWALILASAITGAVADGAGAKIDLGRRSLTTSLLESFFMMPHPKIERCWAVMATDDEADGRDRPVINCDVAVPKSFNITAGIRLGSCDTLDEPVCAERINGECVLAVVHSGKVRATALLDLLPHEMTSDVNHTYCARADVYQDIDGSGDMVSFEYAEREIILTFKGGDGDTTDYRVKMEEGSSEGNSGAIVAAIVGSVVGALVALSLVACFVIKGRHGGTKIHDLTGDEGKPDDDTAKDDEDTVEIV